MTVPRALRKSLIAEAERAEKCSFCDGDPSLFLRRFKGAAEVEPIALVAACLALGRRDQLLHKIEIIATAMEPSPSQWIASRAYRKMFPASDKKFYRFFSYNDFRVLFDAYAGIIRSGTTLGEACCKAYEENGEEPIDTLTRFFGASHLVPSDSSSPCKRLWLFLRWMVRDNSPVDIGLWSWYPKTKLRIPLDVHVLNTAKKLGLTKCAGATLRADLDITAAMCQVFPDDPAKGDFALFSLDLPDEGRKES